MSYYPVFLNLEGKKVVVVGGGPVAARKVNALLKSGASVTVISQSVTKSLETLKQKGMIKHINRTYKKNDLKAAFLVIAATSSWEENIKIARDAKSLINVVDMPSQGNFIVPSTISRGPLTIAISTSGTS
ncbi:MAG: bifunctional precorrin-2 dehydrogenase/sirohydrochlorin ferrochelatase, partial [Nitrospirae bacterium]|nr:bifunctional precorrin-2 dehydrogenase/sirohydrochlorin ferrochelatase [Nitrospirota bacterium]